MAKHSDADDVHKNLPIAAGNEFRQPFMRMKSGDRQTQRSLHQLPSRLIDGPKRGDAWMDGRAA